MSEVKAILIDIDGDEKRLTVDEARKLYAALGELVGSKTETTIKHEYAPYWRPYGWPYTYNNGTIMCGNTANSTAMMTAQLSDTVNVSAIGFDEGRGCGKSIGDGSDS